MRILVVEKDETLNHLIVKALNESGYKSDSAYTVKDAKYFLDVRHYNLVIIDTDFGLSEVFKFINFAKDTYPLIKIILISNDMSIETEIKCLKMGADDYIRKPINFDLLIARVNVALRAGRESQIKIKDLVILKDEEKIIYKDKETYLKGKSFEVFMHLARYPNQVISKEQLLDAIWEEPELVTPNVIEVAINQIRQKVDKVFKIDTIKTIRRRGYKFCYPKE
ncbi:two-component system, OmpR family, response regulator [Lebetimonas natsushimae]|uniref:Two-component system, OmpR family, response regulator n=1 Tax=Lebetimonas natsushimae TaxID=1936991 RepID=A0A292YBJ4_9BACT|nr:homeostatic response regulator transcription factor HsrA [Lebetimonas natsushimae]GAX86916.1 two-component system, OmpR family, response regulator [Lebetimonas natsushimae]